MIIRGQLQDTSTLAALPANSVDVAVFSPPYYHKDGAGPVLADAIGMALIKALKPRARAFCVFGQVAEDFTRPLWFATDILGAMIKEGGMLDQKQTLFWVKSVSVDNGPVRGHQTPLQGANMVNDGVEFVFQYSKRDTAGKKKALPLDRLADGVAVPYADKGNLTRGTRGKNGDKRCRGSALFIPYPTTGKTDKKEHRHEFPEALVEYLIKLSGAKPGQTVLDLFHGGGTTQRVAERLGMGYVGVQWVAP